MKKWLALAVTTVAALTILAGCQKQDSTTKESAEKGASENKVEKIRLGVMPSTDNIPFILAHDEGMDKKNGVDLDVKVFKSALDRDAAFQAGELDGIITDLVGVAIYKEAGNDVKIVGAPHDQFDLVVSDDVTSMADLKGKPVVFSERTGTAYAVNKMLEAENMTVDDIVVKEIPQVPTRLELLKNGQVSGAILPEPFITIGKSQGLKVLSSTRDLGINPFAIVFNGEVIKEKGDAIRGMFESYKDGVAYIQSHDKADYIDLFVKEVGFPEAMKETIEIPEYGALEQVKQSDIESVFEFAKDEGLLTKEVSPEEVLSNVYFK